MSKPTSGVERAFEEWLSLDDWEGDCESYAREQAFKAGWLEACRQSAKAAWEAKTHHDAVEAINKIAEAIVFEP